MLFIKPSLFHSSWNSSSSFNTRLGTCKGSDKIRDQQADNRFTLGAGQRVPGQSESQLETLVAELRAMQTDVGDLERRLAQSNGRGKTQLEKDSSEGRSG